MKDLNLRPALTPIAIVLVPLSLLALSGCSAASTPPTPENFIQGSWSCEEIHQGEEQYNRTLQFDVTGDRITLTQETADDPSSRSTSEYGYTISGTTLTTTPTDGGSGWTIALPEDVLFDDTNVVEITEGWTQLFEVKATKDAAEWSMEPSTDLSCQRTGDGAPSAPSEATEPEAEPSSSQIEVGELFNPNSADFIPVPSFVGEYRLVNQVLIDEEGLACSASDLFQIEPYGKGSKSTYLYANADGIEQLRADTGSCHSADRKLGFLEFGFANFPNEEAAQAEIFNGREPNVDGTDIRCGEADMSAVVGNGGIVQTCALARGTAGATISESRAQDAGDGTSREHLAELLTAFAGSIPRLQD